MPAGSTFLFPLSMQDDRRCINRSHDVDHHRCNDHSREIFMR
jgi:hypothetical protein